MKISSINFLRSSLLIPYIFAVLLYGLSLVFDSSTIPESNSSVTQIVTGTVSVIVELTSVIYLFGAMYWLIPYTVLVIFLWIWSRKKSINQIYKLLILSPFILAVLIPTYSIILSFLKLNKFSQFYSDTFVGSIICGIPLSLLFGYVFISITSWIYGSLKSRNIIMDEEIAISSNE